MAFSTREAREAVRGLGEEIGVKMPRFVSSFVSDLGVVGPALAMAFTPIAVIGLASVLSEIPGALDKGINKLQGWDEEAKKAFTEATASASKFEYETIKLNEEVAKIGLIGKTGVEKFNLAMAIAVDTTDQLKAQQKTYSTELEGLQSEMKSLEEQTKTSTLAGKALFEGYSALGGIALKFAGAGKTIEQDKIRIDDVTKSMERLRVEIEHRTSVEKPTIDAEKNEAKKDAAKKYQEFLENTYTTEVKLTQETAAKELAEMEKARAERERNDEEIARATQESAKKDLATFQKSVEGKTKIIEEDGKDQLEQIRANTAMQEKITASTSRHGGGDQAINAEALAGYQKEVAVIREMIAAEKELQQTFLAAGMAQDDPKMLESEQRQRQFLQQATVAWQQYQKTVENVAANQSKAIEKSLQQISGDFNKNFISWANGSERFSQAMQHVWTGIADTAMEKMLQIGEKWVVQHVLMTAIDKVFHVQSAAEAAANAAAQIASAKASGLALAGLAGAGGTASMAAAPFPIDLTAPAFGAAMMATAAGFNAFEKGGIVPATGLAQLHRGEMVLPSHISHSVQKMAESNQGGGGHTFNYNPTVHGSSSGGIKDMLEQHGKEFVNYAMREMRRKNYS